MADAIDKKGLAKHYGVNVNTVKYWLKRGCPVLDRRGPNNRLLFDITDVDEWLAAEGIEPGAHGREGGLARQNGTSETVELSPKSGMAVGLEATVERLRELEPCLSTGVKSALEARKTSPNQLLAAIKRWCEIVDHLRKAEKDLLKVQVDRRDLIPKGEFHRIISRLVAEFRAKIEGFCDDITPRLTGELVKVGVEIAELAEFQRQVHDVSQAIGDEWLEELSDAFRNNGGKNRKA